MKIRILTIIALFTAGIASAQVFEKPNVAVKSHGNFNVMKVERSDQEMKITLRFTCLKDDTDFWVSNDFYARPSDDHRIKMAPLSVNGLPVFPRKHHFEKKGDFLDIQFVFLSFPPEVKYIDLMEDCSGDKCYFFRGIILNPQLAEYIDLAYANYRMGNKSEALKYFIKGEELDPYFEFGLNIFNVIWIYCEQGNFAEARKWFEKFQNRFFQDKDLLMTHLKKTPYYNKLIQ